MRSLNRMQQRPWRLFPAVLAAVVVMVVGLTGIDVARASEGTLNLARVCKVELKEVGTKSLSSRPSGR